MNESLVPTMCNSDPMVSGLGSAASWKGRTFFEVRIHPESYKGAVEAGGHKVGSARHMGVRI